MTTATLPRRFIRPVSTAPARRSMLIGFAITLAVGLALLAAASAGLGLAAGSTVMRGVSVAGIELAGLDRAEARDQLAERLPSLSSGEAVVRIDGTDYPVTFEEIGRANDLDGMVAAFETALGMARSEARHRMAILRTIVRRHDVHVWAEDFLRALNE